VTDGRPSAYADLLAALLAVRSDPATARFDAEIAAAEARGTIDGPTARTLRWWQRESLRGLSDHLSAVLPHLLDDLAAAQRDAGEAVQESASAWSAASAATERAAVGGPEPGPSGSHLRPVDDTTPPPPRPFTPGPTLASTDDPPAPRLLRPGFVPPDTEPSAQAAPVEHGAPRPRLLVSGITVRTEGADVPHVVDLTDSTRRPVDPIR
jgi:hypothetical protein